MITYNVTNKKLHEHSVSCYEALDGQAVINQPIVGLGSGKPICL